MKVISLGMGQNIFLGNSSLQARQIEYGKYFEEVHLIVFTPDRPEFQTKKLSENVFLYPTKSKIRFFYFFDFLGIVRKILKNSETKDFAITCQDPFETGIVGALVKLFFGLPLHIQIHTDFVNKYFWQLSFLNKIRFFMAEFVLRYCDRARAVSERVKKSIQDYSKNVGVLPIKVELKDLKLERRKESNNQKNILTVCRLEKEKNLEIAVGAFKKVLENGIDARFTIVGDGSERKKLELLVKILNLEGKVFFAGWQNDLEKYYKDADLYISTSLYEGYGLSVVEAAGFGLPLVLSETGLAAEVFRENESAFICDAKDQNCFAQSISRILSDKNLAQKMGDAAKRAAQNHLDSGGDYYQKYADSITKTAESFKRKNFIFRVIEFKKNIFNSFMALRYFICGITSAGVNIFSLYLFTEALGVWYLYSSVFAFLLSLFLSFVLQKFVVFKDRKIDGMQSQFSKFFVAAVLGVMTNTFLVYIFVDALGIWYIVSQISAGFFVMIQNFTLYKFFIFKK